MSDIDVRKPYDVSLFDQPVTAGTHRHADPHTSTEAAKAKDPGPDQRQCLRAILANGGTGTIDTVCSWFAGMRIDRDRGALSRRLTDLEAGGFIRKTDRTEVGTRGRSVIVWEVL